MRDATLPRMLASVKSEQPGPAEEARGHDLAPAVVKMLKRRLGGSRKVKWITHEEMKAKHFSG